MRRIAWVLLLLFAFAIPGSTRSTWASRSGNVARIAGFCCCWPPFRRFCRPARMRTPGPMQWLVLALYLWFCCTCFWTIDPRRLWKNCAAYFQEMMIVWLVWEFAESPARSAQSAARLVAGSWVLAALTLANFGSPEAIAAGQIRFAADGQDPNDVARFLDLGFPLAALLLTASRAGRAGCWRWAICRWGLLAVLLTASRGGFLAALVALAGCGILLVARHASAVLPAAVLALPALAAALWFIVPHGDFRAAGHHPRTACKAAI